MKNNWPKWRGWELVEMGVGQKAQFPQDFHIKPKRSFVLQLSHLDINNKPIYYIRTTYKDIITVPTYVLSKEEIELFSKKMNKRAKHIKNKTKVMVKRKNNRTGLIIL